MELHYERSCTDADIDVIFGYAKKQIMRYEDPTVLPYEHALKLKKIDITGNISAFRKVYDGNRLVGYFDLYETDAFIVVLLDLYIFPEYKEQGYEDALLTMIQGESDDCIEVYVYQKDEEMYDILEKHGFFISRIVSKSRCVMKWKK